MPSNLSANPVADAGEASESSARSVTLSPIGRVLSPYAEKFGIPRQPGLVPAATGEIVFFPPWNSPDAFRGLDGFSHLWIVFLADRIPADGEFRPTVRPPRLGGNARLGVFATRSLFRPNRLGLSLVRLLGMENGPDGMRLRVGGLDLADGTPVLDVKPYLPYVEAPADATGGFAMAAPAPVAVAITPEVEMAMEAEESRHPGFRDLVRQSLAADPRPAYQSGDEARVYAMTILGVTVRFAADGPDGSGLRVLGLE